MDLDAGFITKFRVQRRLLRLLYLLKHPKHSLKLFVDYLADIAKEKSKRTGMQYYMFSIFAMLHYVAPVFINSSPQNTFALLITLRTLALALCLALCFAEIWPRYWKDKYFPLYWYFTLCYCLPFLAVYTALSSGGREIWLFDAILSLLLLLMLADWATFAWLSVIGISFAYLIDSYTPVNSDIQLPAHELYLFAYFCAFTLLAAFFFMRKRERRTSERLEVMQILGGAIAHEVNSPLAAIRMFAMTLSDIAKMITSNCSEVIDDYHVIKISPNDYDMLLTTIPKGLLHTSQEAIKVVEVLLIALREHYDQKSQEHYIADIVTETIRDCNFSAEQLSLIQCNLDDNFTIFGSRQLLKQVISNILHNCFRHGGGNVNIDIVSKNHKLNVRDNGKGIAPRDVKEIFRSFYTKNKAGSGIGLAYCNIIMKSVGGKITCTSELGKYAEFSLSFPANPL